MLYEVITCTRCIDACPADAITGLAERIEVNPYLCQGGGVCASVCPSGAIRYAYPSARDNLVITSYSIHYTKLYETVRWEGLAK